MYKYLQHFQEEFKKDYFLKLNNFLDNEYAEHTIFPPREQLFRAFELCPLEQVKVVIIGQDPYHGKGQANGLAFSVAEKIALPPSLKNIFKEVARDCGGNIPTSGELERWASQGVLLINSVLSVRSGAAGSHQNKGWERFTDRVIEIIGHHHSGVVYILWGSYAQKKGKKIDATKNLVLNGVHPSPLSAYRGFAGCSHFSKANEYLASCGKSIIEW